MSLKRKLIVLILAIAIVPPAIVMLLSLYATKQTLKESTLAKLRIVTALQKEQLLGVLANHANGEALNKLLSGRYVLKLGEPSREKGLQTYLVNREGLIIADSRSSQNSATYKRIAVEATRACDKEARKIEGLWSDYRGIPVIGLATCIQNSDIQWTLVVEQDVEEAFAPVFHLGKRLIGIGLLAQIAFIALALAIARWITAPFGRLTAVAQAVEDGNTHIRVPTLDKQDEIGVLSRAFNAMLSKLISANEILAEQNRRKSNFVANVSHELRNPLTVVNTALDSLAEGIAGPLTDKQTTLVGMSKRNISRLIRLVSDLLDVAKIEMGKLVLRKSDVDLRLLVTETAEDFSEFMARKHLAYTSDLPQDSWILTGDEDKLRQVVVNLFSNAVKYTPDHGNIAAKLEKSPTEIRFELSNTGPGIPETDYERIFDKYERVTTEKEKETGLGLPIAKDIVDLHDGTIHVSSKPGIVTVFTISLPRT